MELIIACLVILLLFVLSSIGRNGLMLHDFNVERTLPLRGILALLIVVHHLASVVSIDGGYPLVSQFIAWGAPVVCVFFFIIPVMD